MEIDKLKEEMSHYKSRCVDLMCENDGLKQALSQRNQEILKVIENLEWDFVPRYNNPKNIENVGYFAGRFGNFEVETKLTKELFKELKKQLTNSEGKI